LGPPASVSRLAPSAAKRAAWLARALIRSVARLSLPVAATLLCPLAWLNPAHAQTVSLVASRDFAVGRRPFSVAVGDFNGDGVQDLAVANCACMPNTGNGTISVILGNRLGTPFVAEPTPIPVGNGPISVAVGDFNSGDSHKDLAVVNYNDNTVSVLLGNGDGTFQPALAPPIPVGNGPVSVAVGNFNGGKILDLAVVARNANAVWVLRGDGTGNFLVAQTLNVGIFPVSVAVGDFNNDGIQDLAVANADFNDPNFNSSSISVLLGSGNGFQPARTFALGYTPWSVAVGDFNGDGKPDLAVANRGGDIVNGPVTDGVVLGHGDGSFATKPKVVGVGV